MKITEKITITNEDNMELMARYPDNYFDLAIVDPVYGDQVVRGGYMKNSSSNIAKNKKYNNNLWEQPKTKIEYFTELFRVSKNQIIWGGNYFIQEININTSSFIVWDKDNGNNDFADCELAWTSFNTAVRRFKFKWQGMLQEDMGNKEIRIHPTQKPVPLYKWTLDKYAKPGDKILDTHLGSGSHAIACHDYGFELTACELDPDYYLGSIERIKRHVAFNQSLFTPQQLNQQKTLFQ
ncbi:DNA methyltransferase [Chryseobacterium indologenes]|uniref:DNA methyltransferase n=1 Tax=Chryseobacterium indologenes TaxID=253 RepID=UPI003D33DCA0